MRIVGLQCHIGSQITDLGPLEESARELAALSRRLLERGFALETIDIGGGLGVDYDGAGAPTPEAFAARVLPELRGLPLTVLVEPGRSLVARAGALLTRVLDVKENRGRTFVVVDAGMNDLLRPALYGAYHRIEPVRRRGRPSVRVDVVGPVCETADFLARDRELEAVEPGELLAVRDAGAYGFSMASTYNMRPRPAEVLVEGGAARLTRRRETFEDLVGGRGRLIRADLPGLLVPQQPRRVHGQPAHVPARGPEDRDVVERAPRACPAGRGPGPRRRRPAAPPALRRGGRA